MHACMHIMTLSSRFSEAAYRYYKTKCEEESSKRRGLEASLKEKKRRLERVQRVTTPMQSCMEASFLWHGL